MLFSNFFLTKFSCTRNRRRLLRGKYVAYIQMKYIENYNRKLENVEQEMNRLQIKILELSEVRWLGAGTYRSPKSVLYYSGGVDPNRQYGVTILIFPELEKSIIDFVPLGDRVMFLRLLTTHRVLNVIQAYVPTSDKPDEAVEEFYSTLEYALNLTKEGEIAMVLSDFNKFHRC